MSFSDWFHPQNAGVSNTGKSIDQIWSEIKKSPIPMSIGISPYGFTKKKNDLEYLHNIPLGKRMEMLVDTGVYQTAFQDVVEKEIQNIKLGELERLKKEDPELAKKIGLKNIAFGEGAMDQIWSHSAEVFLKAIFKKEEIKKANLHLLDPKEELTKTDRSVLKICIHVWKNNPEFLAEQYGVRLGSFQSMIAKGATDLADMIGKAFKNDPRTIVCYGVECCRGIVGFNRGETIMAADRWVARWLDPKMLKTLIQERKLMPLVGSKTEEPTQEDIKRTQRYQANFKTALLYYFFKTPTQAQSVFRMVIPHIAKMDQGMQEQVWGILFQKYKVDPRTRDDVSQYMSTFLSQGTNPQAQRIMYSLFIKTVPPALRAEVLGHMPVQALKRYLRAFGTINKNVPYALLQTDQNQTYLAWHLFHEKELNDEQMRKILEEACPKRQRNFLFSPKKQMDRAIFSHMCGIFSKSQFYFWQWVRSFKNIRDFNGSLAEIYLTIPESVKENKNYVAAMNNHFDLVRECALKGDTASLSALKRVLGAEIFWESLIREREGKISGARAICRQGKRSLLKLLSDLPISRQQAFFMTTDSKGHTLLAECTGSLARLVPQEVFKQVYQKQTVPETKEVLLVDPAVSKESTEAPKRPKKVVQRQIIRIPVFESHMEQIANNTKLVQEVEETIATLSRMSKAEMFTEMRGGWKHHGCLDKEPCVVKDIRGKNYRLGYLLQGDVEQGTGQIAFLFFLTHAQYNSFLNRQADQAIRTAKAMMEAQKPTPKTANPNTPILSGPAGPAGGNDGR